MTTKIIALVPVLGLLTGCGQSSSRTSGSGGATASGSGGAAGTGGKTGSGGSTSTGGLTGGTATGGTTGGGGATGATGDAASGGSGASTGATSGAASGGSGVGGGGVSGSGGAHACAPPTVTLSGTDAVAGTLVQFNDNGGWNWFQDERAVVDTRANKLIIGSVADGGLPVSSRSGNIEATIYDLTAGTSKVYTVSTTLVSTVDDHNAPALVIRPDGKYVVMWSGHRVDCYSRYSLFDGTNWATENKFDWTPLGCPWPESATNMITYANPWYMGTGLYSAFRSVNTTPAFLSSTDDGLTWSYYGELTTPSPKTGALGGYYKYWGNNTDRVDFLGTEAHPRDFDNSLWHGYVQGGMVYDSFGKAVDTSLKDSSPTTSNAKDITAYTQVFKTGSMIHGVVLNHAWIHDVVRYADGTIAALWQARVDGTGTDDPDKRMLYARFDGTSWKLTYLVKGGPKLFTDEQDYLGLGALDPDDPTSIYISTSYDPRDDTTMTTKHEIYRGTTCDAGATFTWTNVTQNSTADNLRPIIPKWDSKHTALLWLQGAYTTAQFYDLKVVGTISGK